ncbi:hypothetical protein EUTSA_v10005529mg [Eutrema salsugineum]|uniref:AP2/ERF domain-containing protein n=1 Tax=Eutrema salsugineum TaxID=72664 RepID=V4KMZ1_EUTSA|nr:hypothetical protein EUTSA_v10005529mg [Eutrema salsugineum]
MANWLTFSLSPMEMLKSPDQSHFVSYDASSAPYLIDNLYVLKEEAQIETASMADSTTLATFFDSQTHSPTQVPKLEDFFGDSSTSFVRYSDNQTERQNSSSLTRIYDPRHHTGEVTGYFADHHHDFKTIACFQTNSGSEIVDDSASIGRAHLSKGGEFHVVDSSTTATAELGFHGGCTNGGALSLAVNNTDHPLSRNHGERGKNSKKTIVSKKDTKAVESTDDSKKKIAETFGQRTSIYRGVTRHRWTGRYEAHLWDNSCRREGQARKGRQGGYDKEDKAARAYDLAALKYWGSAATTNFQIASYSKELEEMNHMTKQEFIASLRRTSSGFSRGASIYRGVTRHHQQGRWQARIGRVAGNKDLYLGTFATEEEAAEAYDIAAIKFRGINAVTNFEMNRYDVEAVMKSSFPVGGGGAAKRHKLSLESPPPSSSSDRNLQQHLPPSSSSELDPNSIPCGIPFESSVLHHHQDLFQHYPAVSDSTTVDAPMNQAEFFLWPNHSY